jgi:hypothetical protein
MRFYKGMISLATAVLILGGGLTAIPAAAQYDQPPPPPPPPYGDVPTYTTWQPGWDAYNYDRRHVLLGRVTDFHPYRLVLMRRNGEEQMIDLKHGTVIYPTGATPYPGERVAIVGYYSNGTFIANRVIIRP